MTRAPETANLARLPLQGAAIKDVRNIFVYFCSVKKTRIRLGMSFVRFGLKTRFGSYIIVIFYLCRS